MKKPFKSDLATILALMELSLPISAFVFFTTWSRVAVSLLLYGLVFCLIYLGDSYYSNRKIVGNKESLGAKQE